MNSVANKDKSKSTRKQTRKTLKIFLILTLFLTKQLFVDVISFFLLNSLTFSYKTLVTLLGKCTLIVYNFLSMQNIMTINVNN